MSRRRPRPPREQPSTAVFVPNPKLKLLDQCREALRFWHYSYRTEQTYVDWIHRFIRFCRDHAPDPADGTSTRRRWRHPRDCGEVEIKEFLSHLASDRHVAASTQNQALNAVVFLYREVLNGDLGEFSNFVRATRPARLPAVLTTEECAKLFASIRGRCPRLDAGRPVGAATRSRVPQRLSIGLTSTASMPAARMACIPRSVSS